MEIEGRRSVLFSFSSRFEELFIFSDDMRSRKEEPKSKDPMSSIRDNMTSYVSLTSSIQATPFISKVHAKHSLFVKTCLQGSQVSW